MPILTSFSCSGLIALLSICQSFPQEPDERVLIRKGVRENQELVVIQRLLIAATELKHLLPMEVAERMTGCFSLAVELHSKGKPPVLVWSRLSWFGADWETSDFQVFDLLALPGRLVLVGTSAKSSIFVLEISLLDSDRSTSLKPADWTLVQTSAPADRRLSATLSHDEQRKQIIVEVVDFLQNTKQHTLFQQKIGQWEFIRVKQWQEKVPATHPSGG